MKISNPLLSSFFLLLVGFLPLSNVHAFLIPAGKAVLGPLSKKAAVLSGDEINKLAKMIKGPGDVAKVKNEVGHLVGSRNLSKEAIEDAYTRIAIQRRNISRAEAETMFNNLRGVEGFGSTMSKIIGMNPAGTRGHLNELRIANAAAGRGFKVEGIGVKYSDGIKKGPTDLDVLLSKNGKKFPIEAKDYDDLTFHNLSNTMRPDMDSLVAYKKMSPAPGKMHPIFTVTNKPSDPNVLRLMQKEADKRGIQLIYGSPDEQMIQIKQLSEIL